MILNLANEKVTADQNKVREVDEREFWEYYLRLLNINTPYLTEAEIQVMSYALAGDPEVSQFKGDGATKIRKGLRVSRERLSYIKKCLVDKGFLVESENSVGNALANPSLRKFQKYIKGELKNKSYDVKLTFPFRIESSGQNQFSGESAYSGIQTES